MAIRIVFTPGGRCPHNLKSVDREAVIEWANAVIEAGMSQSLKYTTEAIKYWVRHYFDYGSDEHVLVCRILTEEFGTTPAEQLDAEFKKPNSKEKMTAPIADAPIADIDSFAVAESDEEEDEDNENIIVKKNKK